jgi:hypothetical protein
MDCNTARQLVAYASPLRAGELDQEETAALQDHLRGCSACAGFTRVEREVDAVLGRAMLAVPVPDGLRNRIVANLDAVREVRYRRVTRRWLGTAAAAAAVAAALFLGFDWFRLRHRTRIDLDLVAQQIAEQGFNPTPANIELAFANKHSISTKAPTDLNYALLSYYDTTELQGHIVPFLLFIQGDKQARVFILSDRQFDLGDALAHQAGVGSGCKVEVRGNLTDPRFAYLIVYTSETLEPFTENHPSRL